jgi:hypothetical protein
VDSAISCWISQGRMPNIAWKMPSVHIWYFFYRFTSRFPVIDKCFIHGKSRGAQAPYCTIFSLFGFIITNASLNWTLIATK